MFRKEDRFFHLKFLGHRYFGKPWLHTASVTVFHQRRATTDPHIVSIFIKLNTPNSFFSFFLCLLQFDAGAK